MKRTWKHLSIGLLFILFTFLVVACQSNDADKNNNDKNNNNKNEENNGNENNVVESEEITLKFGFELEDEDQDALREEFPHITFEFEGVSAHEDDIEEEIAKENLPDIFYLSGGDQMPNLVEYELDYDLSEMIEKYDFDTSTITDAHMDIVRKWSDGEIKYLPFIKRWDVLYYNKDIFDRFGVDYPEDGMTWDEIERLARDVNGEIDGTEYRGIDISSTGAMINSLDVNHVDPETDESLYDTDERFTKYLRMIDKIASIPGVVPDDEERDWGEFIGEQTVAMMPLFDIHIWLSNVEEDTGLSWDMVSYPTWDDEPNKGPVTNASGLTIARTSEHKDEAFQVLAYLLSKESQMMRSKAGSATVLDDTEVQEAFSSEIDGLKDKNMGAVFFLEESVGPEKRSEYEEEGELIDGIEFIHSGLDINTYLRELSEEADLAIQDAKGSN